MLEALQTMPNVCLSASIHRSSPVAATRVFNVGPIDRGTDWVPALKNQNIVIHTAGLAHFKGGKKLAPLVECRRVNVEGTLAFASQAAESGVRRFIYISSTNVYGTEPCCHDSVNELSYLRPDDLTGVTKLEVERGLLRIASETCMQIVIIRSPMIYGPGAKGNFASLSKLVALGLPLPLGSINNQRSLVALDNLVDLIITCIDHPEAVNQVFLAGDGQDLSTSDLLRGVALAMGKPSRLIPVPEPLLMLVAKLLGKRAVAQRLLGSLQVDISKARDLLGWEPPISVEEGLRRCFQSQDK